MPLNVMGGVKVYTVPEVDNLIKRSNGYMIVDKLPALATAKAGMVYYKKAQQTIPELVGYRRAEDINGDSTSDLAETMGGMYTVAVYVNRPTLTPYIVGTTPVGGRVWYTTTEHSAEMRALTEQEVLDIWNRHKFGYTSVGLIENPRLGEHRLTVQDEYRRD